MWSYFPIGKVTRVGGVVRLITRLDVVVAEGRVKCGLHGLTKFPLASVGLGGLDGLTKFPLASVGLGGLDGLTKFPLASVGLGGLDGLTKLPLASVGR